MIEKMLRLQREVELQKPLIHCITNPISIHDCANVILAAGARPIMAEHPGEAAEITSQAKALMLNLGNITDVRMESMERSLKKANEKGIPVLLDLVGIACSSLRFSYAAHLLEQGQISILKGNMSELLAVLGKPSHSVGIDVGDEDVFSKDTGKELLGEFRSFSRKQGAVLLASGPQDLIVDKEEAWLVSNGLEMLSRITGTGCMLGALCTSYLAVGDGQTAAAAGAAMMGIAGEKAAVASRGPGSFQYELLDQLYQVRNMEFADAVKITRQYIPA